MKSNTDFSTRSLSYYQQQGGIYNNIITELQRLRSCKYYCNRISPCQVINNAEKALDSFLSGEPSFDSAERLSAIIEREGWSPVSADRRFTSSDLSFTVFLYLLCRNEVFLPNAMELVETLKNKTDIYRVFHPLMKEMLPQQRANGNAVPIAQTVNITNHNYSIGSNVFAGVANQPVVPTGQLTNDNIIQLINYLKSCKTTQE